MTWALEMCASWLMLHKFEITKSNMTESKSVVETELNMKLAYFKTSGEAPEGPSHGSDQPPFSLKSFSPLASGGPQV